MALIPRAYCVGNDVEASDTNLEYEPTGMSFNDFLCCFLNLNGVLTISFSSRDIGIGGRVL